MAFAPPKTADVKVPTNKSKRNGRFVNPPLVQPMAGNIKLQRNDQTLSKPGDTK